MSEVKRKCACAVCSNRADEIGVKIKLVTLGAAWEDEHWYGTARVKMMLNYEPSTRTEPPGLEDRPRSSVELTKSRITRDIQTQSPEY